jgi:hypothetical protein
MILIQTISSKPIQKSALCNHSILATPVFQNAKSALNMVFGALLDCPAQSSGRGATATVHVSA